MGSPSPWARAGSTTRPRSDSPSSGAPGRKRLHSGQTANRVRSARSLRNRLAASGTPAEAEQTKAIAQIEALGGRVTVDEKSPGRPVIEVHWFGRPEANAGLALLKGLTQLQLLELAPPKSPMPAWQT